MFIEDLEERTQSDAKVVNVSVKYLRPDGYEDIKEWMAYPNNVYVGRRNHYVGVSGSKWANPFPVGEDYTYEESLKLYRQHVMESGLVNDLNELRGKTLGCWCVTDTCAKCHAVVLAQMLREGLDKGDIERLRPDPNLVDKVNDAIVDRTVVLDDDSVLNPSGKIDPRNVPTFNSVVESDQDFIVKMINPANESKLYAMAPNGSDNVFDEELGIADLEEKQMRELQLDTRNSAVVVANVRQADQGDGPEDSGVDLFIEPSEVPSAAGMQASFFPEVEGKDKAVADILKVIRAKFDNLSADKQELIALCWFNRQMYGSTYSKAIEAYLKKL